MGLTMQRHTTLTQRAGIVLFALGSLMTIPVAAAAKLPLVGEFHVGFNWGFFAIVLMFLGIAALIGGGRKLVSKIPIAGKMIAGSGAVVAVIGLLMAAFINPGGFLSGGAESAAASFGDSDATLTAVAGTGAVWSAALYEPTSDVTFYSADAATRSSVNPTIKVYKPGVTEKAAFEGSAVPEYQGTLSSGKLEITGIQVQTLGCDVAVSYTLANYYQLLVPHNNICRAKNALGTNDVSLATAYLEAFGTISLSKTDTSLTCTAGTQCSYSLIVRNSATDKSLNGLAVKFTNVANTTLDSVDAGADCELVDVQGTQYVVFTGDAAAIGSLGTVTCPVKVTYASGSADGSFKWTADDLWQAYGATAWNTNSNIKGASATSATTVSMA